MSAEARAAGWVTFATQELAWANTSNGDDRSYHLAAAQVHATLAIGEGLADLASELGRTGAAVDSIGASVDNVIELLLGSADEQVRP